MADPDSVGRVYEYRKMPLLSTQFRSNAILQADQPLTFFGSAVNHPGHEFDYKGDSEIATSQERTERFPDELNTPITDRRADSARHQQAELTREAATRNMRMHGLERARTELARCTIKSPIDGVVISRNVDVGQTVAANMTATVNIIPAGKPDVLRVRNTALRARLPDAILPPASPEPDPPGGRLEAVQIRTGMTDGVHTEILHGLAEGDALATGLDLQAGEEDRPRVRLFGSEPARFCPPIRESHAPLHASATGYFAVPETTTRRNNP